MYFQVSNVASTKQIEDGVKPGTIVDRLWTLKKDDAILHAQAVWRNEKVVCNIDEIPHAPVRHAAAKLK